MNNDQIQSLVRAIVKGAGGALVANGYTNSSGLETLAGAAALIAGIVWAHFHHADTSPSVSIATNPNVKDMLKTFLLIAVPSFMLIGCVQVPASRLTFMGATAYLPKDFTADRVHAEVKTGTNSFVFDAVKMTTKNNPDVINASTAQLEAVINATANAAGAAAAQAAKTAAK